MTLLLNFAYRIKTIALQLINRKTGFSRQEEGGGGD